jgi:integrase
MKKQNVSAAQALPPELAKLLARYAEHCRKEGLRESSIKLCQKIDRWFLEALAVNGCESEEQIDAAQIVAGCLALKSNYYLSTVKTFLRFLFAAGHIDRDYAMIVPLWKRPQVFPSVYSEGEVKRLEAAVSGKRSKRNYAILLLASRLGLRSSDIARLGFGDMDFEKNTLRIVQQKTGFNVELPLLPEIRTAIRDYIQNERPDCGSDPVFLTEDEPHRRMNNRLIGKITCLGLKTAGIEPGNRKSGPHALRSSLASSMVNDDVPYEVVRKVLGHFDANAIKHYAGLNIEQLRVYALAVPEASGGFGKLLCGKRVMK